MKKFKRFLLLLLLLPIMPIMGIPDGGGDGDKGSDTGGDKGTDKGDDKSGDKGSDTGGDNKDGGKAGDTGKTFTQEQLDDIITKRLDRERKSWEQKLEDEKKKAAMTESERLKTEKEEAEKKATAATERANQRLIRSEVIAQSTAMNIVDADAAFALIDREGISVDDSDNVKGVKEALEALVKAKPYLVDAGDGTRRAGDHQSGGQGGKGGFSMNDLIRKAAGRG